MNLLIYYNPNQKHFYMVYTIYSIFNKEVGYENSFGHILVQILILRNGKYVSVESTSELYSFPHEKESIKSRLAKRAIRWLDKYRD